MLRFALPEYRLPRDVLDREIEIIRRLGVQFVFNSRIGTDISLNDLEAKFDAVFLSIGTWKESQVRVPGTELTGVYGALHFLEAEAQRPVAANSAKASSSSAAATPPSIAPAPRSARVQPLR